VRRVTLDEWPLLAALYQAEPAHFVRPADLEQNLCFWWNCGNPEIFLVESEGRPVAYAELGWCRWQEERGRRIAEYAGSRAALLDAMPLLFRETGHDLIIWDALAQDRGVALPLPRDGSTDRVAEHFRHHPPDQPPGADVGSGELPERRVPARDLALLSFRQEGEICTFALGEHALNSVFPRRAARLRPPRGPRTTWRSGSCVVRIFPLPTIQPGFNYV